MRKRPVAKSLHSERPLTSREESSEEKRLRTCEPPVKNKIFDIISASLTCEEWPLLRMKLGLDPVVLYDLEKDANINKHGREASIIQMLEKWQQRENLSYEERDQKLKTTLAEIGRNDISAKIQEVSLENDDSDFLKKIQEVLKKIFKDLTLPTSVWLEKKRLPLQELFVELTMKNEEEHKVISREEVFLETVKGIPRRILVEGQPGYGKTTLVAKFLSDWARGEKYLTDRFDLVFVIALRNYTGNLRVHLLQHCERVKTSEEHKMRVIESIKERVLLLLDGLDEIPFDVQEKIFPLIMGDEYPEMTVVVTCRIGCLQMETKSDKLIIPMKIKNLETESICDKRVKIEGVSSDNRKEFLQKYLKINGEKLEEQLSQTNLEMNDLYQCPLFLLLLAVLVQETDIRPIKTKTELYKTIFNFVINRGLERLTGKRADVDVFDDSKSKSDVSGCRNFLINFGRLCLQKIKKQSLIFERSELLKCSNGNGGDEELIFKLGFLSKQVNFVNYEEKEFYEPIHRSFLEFSAAFYLFLSDEMEREIHELMLKCDIWPEEDQLLYPFLGGFLHCNAFKLFNAFSTFKGLISIFSDDFYEYAVENILLEIPQTEEIFKSLENLSVGDWESVRYKKSRHGWLLGLLKYCRKCDEEMTIDASEFLDVINDCSDIKINRIHVKVNEEATNIKCGNIQCRNLIITMKKLLKDSDTILKEIITKIKAENVWMEIFFASLNSDDDRDNLITFFKEISRDNVQLFNFHQLSLINIPPSSWCLIYPYIQNLIKQQNIKFGVHVGYLEEHYSFKKEFSSFVENVFKSHLQSFSVDNFWGKEPLPFPIISFDDEKQMQLIRLRGKFEFEREISYDEMKSISVKHLKCYSYSDNLNAKLLKKCINVKMLSCDDNLISDLGKDNYISEWKGIETIDRLEIYKCLFLNRESFRKGLSLFQNVRELFLDTIDMESEYIKLIVLLPYLKKIHFNELRLQLLENLLVLNEQKGESGFGFEEMKTEFLSFEHSSLMDITKCIEECFLKNVFLQLLFSYFNEFQTEIFKYFMSKDEFQISYQMIETHPYDSNLFSNKEMKYCIQKIK